MRWWSAALFASLLVTTQSQDEGHVEAQPACLVQPWSATMARSMLNIASRTVILKQRLMEKEFEQAHQNLVFTNWSLANWSDASNAMQDLIFTNWSLENLSDASFVEPRQDAPKPPQFERSIGKDGQPKGNPLHTFVKAQCHQSVYAPDGSCPRQCPFFEEDSQKACFFQCVKESECGQRNPEHRVAEKDGSYCRACMVAGCSVCASGPVDKCAECNLGYILSEDGTCASQFERLWKTFFAVVGAVVVFLLLWYLHLACHPTSNAEGLEEALAFRSSLKLHVPKHAETQVFRDLDTERSSGRRLWPLHTNLHTEEVAGPGLALHFNFQLYNIIWAAILVTVWLIFAFQTDSKQLSLGLEGLLVDPRVLCSSTLSGKALYDKNIEWKVVFLIIIYAMTFVGCIAYSVLQQYYFDLSRDKESMEDYAALCTGLPPLPGTEEWETRLQEAIQSAGKQEVVGVSICWEFEKHADVVQDVLERDIVALDLGNSKEAIDPADASWGLGGLFGSSGADAPEAPKEALGEKDAVSNAEARAGFCGKIDSAVMNFFGFGSAGAASKELPTEEDIKNMLNSQVSSKSAFIVFETEAARDSAVEEMKQGVAFQGAMLTFEKATALEPNTTRWEAFSVTKFTFVSRIVRGLLLMITAATLWTACFYLPYAYFNSRFSYQSGEEPTAAEAMVFSLVVTVGNQVMYQICAAIGEWIGFTSRDGVEGAFVALYFFAITLQVLFDLIVEGYIGWLAMLAKGTHTADGRPLEDLNSFEQVFASYPVQVVLGKRLFAYCFPGTFLLPFLIEPVGAVFMPYYICKLLVRTHPEVRGRDAEKALMFFTPMDMGRYGDILLNFMLAVLVFFFPSGQILKLFLVYIVSHIWIYVYDHYRVLRSVPAFYYASNSMDLYVQMLLAVPCATLAACIVFKGNCVTNTWCFRGNLGFAVAAAFLAHLVFHWLALLVAVNLAKRLHRHKVQEVPYSEAAGHTPVTWFSSNPIHCLRSKYLYKHSPPCDYWIHGKEHLIRKNPKIGVYYEDKTRAAVEDYKM